MQWPPIHAMATYPFLRSAPHSHTSPSPASFLSPLPPLRPPSRSSQGACLIVGPEACRPVLAPLAAEAAAAFVPSDPLEGKELEERDADEEKAGIEALKNVPFSHAGVPWGAVGCWVPWGAVGCCGVPWGAVGCCEHSAFASYVLASDPLEGKKLEERNADEEKAGIEALKNVPFSHAAALIVYTSGTTGRPKGVVHSHIGLASQAGMLVDAWDFSPSDRVLNVLPLHHIRPHAPFHPLFLLPHRLHCPCTFSTCLILLYPFSTCVAAAPYPPTRTFPSPLSPATHRLHCPCPFSTCLILLYPFSTCAASAPYPPTCTFPSPLSPATHRLPCPCPFSTCLILLYPFSTCAAAAPYPPIHTSPCFSLPATHHLPCPFPYTSQQGCLSPLRQRSSSVAAVAGELTCRPVSPQPSLQRSSRVAAVAGEREGCMRCCITALHSTPLRIPSGPLAPFPTQVEFLPSHRFSAAAVWQRWRESYPDGSAVVITRPPSLPLPLSRPVLPSFSGRVPPIPLPRKSSSQAIAWETKKVELLPSHRFSAAPMWQRWRERGVHVSLHHCSPPLHTLAPFPPRPSFSPATASAQQPCGSGGERATPTGGALRAARLHHILHRGANQAKPLRAAAAGVHATFSPLPPVPPRSSSSPTIASVQRLCGSAGEKGELPRRESSSSPTIASAQQQCGSAGGREGRMCRCITALHPLAHPFTPLSPITFRSSSSPTTASAQQPCGSGGEKATPMVAAPSRNLFTAPSLTSLSSRRSSFSPATTSAQQPCGSGGERATPMGAHATSPPLPTSSHLFPLALTPSIAPHAPVTGRIPPQPSLQRSSRVAAVARKLPRRPVEFFPSHRFSAAAVWQRWRESYPDGRCAQPDSITFFTGVPTHYMRLLQEFDRMPLQLQRKSALAASKLRLMMSGSAACPDELMRRWHQVTGQRLLERYGMTEFAMALTNPLLGEKKSGSVGVPLRGVKFQRVGWGVGRAAGEEPWHGPAILEPTPGNNRGVRSTGVVPHGCFFPPLSVTLLAPIPAHSRSLPLNAFHYLSTPVIAQETAEAFDPQGWFRIGARPLTFPSPFSLPFLSIASHYLSLPLITSHYLSTPVIAQETAEAFDPQGWFRTGDIASVDSHGYWQIHGRASVDIIKTRGFKVSALEIESKLLEAAVLGVQERQQGEAVAAVVVLGAAQQQNHHLSITLSPLFPSQHPLISEAAVLGVPERQQGEAVAAVVVLGAAQQQHQQQGVTGESVAYTCENACPVITLDELRKWAAPRMAHYKVPSRLRVVATMPCNAMGKVNKKDLLKNLFAPMQQS
ncbi:unnamed protein product [Closterium sp. NIES-65]|nr:unnamed protein product [Closterium sp. NIES-65]